MAKGLVSVADLEKVMGRKASKITEGFDPETGAFTRNITFDLKPKKPTKTKKPR